MLRLGVLVLGLCCVLVVSGSAMTEEEDKGFVSLSFSSINLSSLAGKAQDWYEAYFSEFSCDKNCTFDSSSWGPVRYACTSDGELVPNSFCSTFKTYINCKSQQFHTNPEGEYSIVSPGSCVCPSDCSSRGSCGFSGCTCHPGYQGPDCKLVKCGDQKCNRRGMCATMEDLEIDTCVCNDGYAANDCAAEMNQLPPIPNLLGYDQYYPWDEYGDENPIFNESTIAQIYITVDPDDLSELILPSNQDTRIYKHANFSFYNGAISERMEDVGFRIKGGASRNFAKKSWKISFSKFVEDRRWYQQKKISLKGSGMDPLFLRERASLASIRSMSAPAQRSSHANLYINGQYWGVYILLEEPGSNQFLKSRFGNDHGSLWKISGGNGLKWEGSDPEPYRQNEGYVPQNDNAEASYAPLINFIDILNNAPDDEFEAQISTVFNVEFFLRTLVAEVATGNWDGVMDGNNYFLYYNTDSLFYYYRYDVDLSFGSLEEEFRGATRNVWTWAKFTFGRRLVQRILSVPSFQSIYADYLLEVIKYTKWDPNGDFTNRLQIMHKEIAPIAKDDEWHTMDLFAFSTSEFETNIDVPILRPNVYPPQPVFNEKDITVYMAVSDFLRLRVETIKKQVAAGPPN